MHPDKGTVVVQFKDAFPPFVYYAASGWNPIFAKEIFDRDGNFSSQILGLGPWQLDMGASQKNTRYVWKKNANFYDPNLPYIDEVRNIIIIDQAAQLAAFQTKQTDVLHQQLGVREYKEMLQKVPDVAGRETYNSVADWRLYMNIRKTPFTDARVRKAMSMAIDRDTFLKTLGDGKYRLSFEGVQPGLFTEDEIRKRLPFNLAEAKRLLAEAGYANGVDVEVTFPGNDYGEIYRSGLQLFQAQLKQAGINLHLKAEDKSDWNASAVPVTTPSACSRATAWRQTWTPSSSPPGIPSPVTTTTGSEIPSSILWWRTSARRATPPSGRRCCGRSSPTRWTTPTPCPSGISPSSSSSSPT